MDPVSSRRRRNVQVQCAVAEQRFQCTVKAREQGCTVVTVSSAVVYCASGRAVNAAGLANVGPSTSALTCGHSEKLWSAGWALMLVVLMLPLETRCCSCCSDLLRYVLLGS